MARKTTSVYGIKTLNVNGTDVYTYRVRVKALGPNIDILKQSNIPWIMINTAKGKQLLEIQLTTMDRLKFDLNVQVLGKALKQIAQNKLNQRYWFVNELNNNIAKPPVVTQVTISPFKTNQVELDLPF
jgi:hypothetical protein